MSLNPYESQHRRVYAQYQAQGSDLRKWVLLTNLRDRNEVLYYELLSEHLAEVVVDGQVHAAGAAELLTEPLDGSPSGVTARVRARGTAVLGGSGINRGTAFTLAQREALGCCRPGCPPRSFADAVCRHTIRAAQMADWTRHRPAP